MTSRTVGGLYQVPESFIPGMTNIVLDGTWITEGRENATETVSYNKNCSTSLCEKEGMQHEKRGCFLNQNDSWNFARKTLKTNQLTKWEADRKMSTLMPGVNVTVIQTFILPGCFGRVGHVACHEIVENNCTLTACHSIGNSKPYQVVVINNADPENQTPVGLIAVCHYDTHEFDGDHIVFQVLHRKPGDPICHFIFYKTFLLCPTV